MQYSFTRGATLLGAIASLVVAGTASGQTTYWSSVSCGNSGYYYSYQFCWNTTGSGNAATSSTAPTSGNVTLMNTGAGSFTIYAYNYLPSLNVLTVDSQGAGNLYFQSYNTSAITATQEIVGGAGTATHQMVSGNNAVGTLYLGNTATGNGTLQLSANLTSTNQYVGYAGTGTFSQSGTGSTNTVNGNLVIASQAGSQGTYTLASGATLTVAGTIIAGSGTSTFNLDGGTLNGALPTGLTNFNVGMSNNATYTLAAGQTFSPSANQTVGQYGTFTQTGGTNNISKNLTIGGTYTLAGGTLNVGGTVSGAGTNGTNSRTLNMDGGTLNGALPATGLAAFNVGYTAGSVATFTLGAGQTLAANTQTVGGNGTGTFNQTGGSNTNTSLYLGYANTGVGGGSATYNLSGASSTLSSYYEYIGVYANSATTGTYAFNQSGGTNTVIGTLGVGVSLAGSYTLSGAGSVLTAQSEQIGTNNATGTFVQSGGTNNAANLNVNGVGYTNVAASSYLLSGSASLVSTNENLNGAFTHTGGTNTVSGTLTVNGTYALSGSGSRLSAGTENIGVYGIGTLNQTGGSHSGGTLSLGYASGNVGTFNLSGAASSVAFTGNEAIGISGTGIFNQSGGAHTVGGGIALAAQAGSAGTYALLGGALTVTGAVTGGTGTSTFSVDGGTFTGPSVTGITNFNVGGSAASAGTFALGAGQTVSATNLTVGGAGTGSFTQTGGSNTVKNLVLGSAAAAQGSYTLAGGTLTLLGSLVGGAGTSTLNLDGGTLVGSAPTGLTNFNVGYTAGSVGTFALAASQALTASAEVIGGSGSGTFTQAAAGSTNTVANNLTVGAGGTYLLTGGTLSVGGTLTNNGSFTVQSALKANTIVNAGLMQIAAQSFSGTGGLTNSGYLTETGTVNLAGTGGSANSGSWALAGNGLGLLGVTFTNAGGLNLGGGLVSGSGTLTNAAGGTIAGPGLITAQLANAGLLAVSGGTLAVTNAFTNAGQIQLGSATSSFAGGAITNTGLIAGSGNISNAISNTSGTIQATAGTLSLGGAVTNTGSGVLSAVAGARLLVSGGLATNAGTIQLSGGTVDNNRIALTNSGSITGYGTLSTGGLNNSNLIEFSSGSTTVNGAVTGLAGSHTILSGAGNATFYGTVDIRSGAELRVAAGSVATFFGAVDEHAGALITGTGQSNFEGQVTIGNAAVLGAMPLTGSGALRSASGLGLLAPAAIVTDAGSVALGSASNYIVNIGGSGNTASYAELEVGNQLTLGGTLTLVTAAGFIGQAGETFQLFSAASQSGAFSAVDASQAQLGAGLAWDTSQLARTGALSIVTADSTVPLPPSAALLSGGLALLGWQARRRRTVVAQAA